MTLTPAFTTLVMRFTSDVHEVWKYRSLLKMLVVRDLKTRYRSSALGVAWSFLQPLGIMLTMTFAFTVINKGPSDIPRFSVFVLSGLLAWNFFSAAVTGATGSVIANGSLVKKVYFPRLILPVSVVISSLINFLLALPVWLIVAVLSGHPLSGMLIMLPAVIFVEVIFCIGVSLLLSTVNVFYRDTQFILELAMLGLFFLTPIWYNIGNAQPLYLFDQRIDLSLWVRRLNPMASFVNIYQDIMYWGYPTDLGFWLRTIVTAAFVLVIGYVIFQHYSPRFGEEV